MNFVCLRSMGHLIKVSLLHAILRQCQQFVSAPVDILRSAVQLLFSVCPLKGTCCGLDV